MAAELWLVTSSRYGSPTDVGETIEKYVRDVYYDSDWTIKTYWGWNTSDAPKNSNGDFVYACGDSDTYGLFNWWADEHEDAGLTESTDDCALLAVPAHHYGDAGCGVGDTATAGVRASVAELSDPDSGDIDLIGDKNNGDWCYNHPAKSIAIMLQEMGHTYKMAHADGMVHQYDNRNLNVRTPQLLGPILSNNCGYSSSKDDNYDERFVAGYTDCAVDNGNAPHAILSYSELQVKSIF